MTQKPVFYSSLFILLILGLSACSEVPVTEAQEPNPTQKNEEIQDNLSGKDFKQLETIPQISSAFGISQNNKHVFKYQGNTETGAVDENSIFEIGSITKQVTAALILEAVANEKMNLEDRINLYLPENTNFDEKITIEHLTYHISHIRNWRLFLN